MSEMAPVGATPMLWSADRVRRRWLGRRRARSGTLARGTAAATGAVRIRLHRDDRQQVTVEVTGQLLRRYVRHIDDALADAFAIHRAWFVIDLSGVSQLDTTALSTVTRHADDARRRGALVTIVPPGTSDRSAA